MKVVAILQARMGSVRLPGKMLLPLAGKPLVQHVIERTMRATRLHEVVLAYPLKDHEFFRPFASTGCSLYAYPGEENDLVGRYLGAADAFQADVIIRIPCDNPCVEPSCINRAVDEYSDTPYIYYSNTTTEIMKQHVDGLGAEVFSRSRLQWLDARTSMTFPIYREHPHKYFESRGLLQLPRADLRLDVNTQADYAFITTIYDHFGHNHFTMTEVLAYLETHGRAQV